MSISETKRDPRVTPNVGDRVAKGERTRLVTLIKQGDVWYRDYKGKLRNCWITTWQDWARNAEIIHAAE